MRFSKGFLICACLLTGCVRSNQLARLAPAPGDHPLYPYQELQYLSCNVDSVYPQDPHASTVLDLDSAHLDAASRAWPYALMSSNVYADPKDSPAYTIPGWSRISRWESPSGLALEEWHKVENGEIVRIAVAFKGTDFTSPADWRTNFALVEPRQYREAFAYMQTLMRRAMDHGSQVVVTGHSLGGAIALNMSLRLDGVDSYGFNTSPRAFYSVGNPTAGRRTLIYEKGEILAFLRWPWWHRLNDYEILQFNFLKFNPFRSLSAVQEHSMYLISRGLLLAAVKDGNPEAGRAFTANLSSVDLGGVFSESSHDVEYCQELFRRYPVN
jgi:pimeloyl-ACP methyl ester carboxylesterase